MKPLVAVLQTADSFAGEWPDVAASVDARLRTAGDLTGLAPVGEASALLLVVPGSESTASELLAELATAGAREVAVVGVAADHRLAVRALRAGAAEYFALPGDMEALRAWLLDRVDQARASSRARELAEAERRDYDFTRIIGESGGLREALRVASRIIPRGSATVLLTGETGTGKELLAQAIHYNGPRAGQPFVEINCTALPSNLLEAELFGYEKGAFTDARSAKPGLFEAAHGGTLFLDEIGDLSVELQAKLLRALEEKQVRRLGSLRSIEVDVRIVAATHVDLPEAIRAGAFRQDLYYRLGVVPIHLPPLRERGEDLLLLADHFLDAFAATYEVDRPRLDRAAREVLMGYAWPGNVRELRNALERVVLLGDGEFRATELFMGDRRPQAPPSAALPFPAGLDEIDRSAARLMLDRTGGNKSAAAEALGISRTRLYRLLDDGV